MAQSTPDVTKYGTSPGDINERKGSVRIAIDQGDVRDPAAIAVAQAVRRRIVDEETGEPILDGLGQEKWETYFEVPVLQPFELMLGSKRIAEIVAQTYFDSRTATKKSVPVEILVDCTGTSLDFLRDLRALDIPAHRIIPVYFTKGDRFEEHTVDPAKDPKKYELFHKYNTLGKFFMVGRLRADTEAQRINVAEDVLDWDAIVEQFMSFDQEMDEDGNEKFGNLRIGTHDDMIDSLGMAIADDHVPAPIRNISSDENLLYRRDGAIREVRSDGTFGRWVRPGWWPQG